MAHDLGGALAHPLGQIDLRDDGRLRVPPVGEGQRIDLAGEGPQLGRVAEALTERHREPIMAQVRNGIARIPMPVELWKKGADMQTPGDLSIPGARLAT